MKGSTINALTYQIKDGILSILYAVKRINLGVESFIRYIDNKILYS